uniref:Uncharacterized protein n=1 Tax=Zea mays TaxID=4577 RepID=B4FDY0_MAIZE|nr:unknown [Zea mays]
MFCYLYLHVSVEWIYPGVPKRWGPVCNTTCNG